MSYKDTLLDPHLQKLVDMNETGTDIMHGHMKNLMYECETKLLDISELQDMPEYKYLSGRLDALTEIYIMTYNLSFAINERAKQRG
jgi:hypothetical protein